MRFSQMGRWAAAVAAALGLVACTSSQPSGTTPGTLPSVSSTPSASSPSVGPTGPSGSSKDLIHEHVIDWTAKQLSDRVLRLSYSTGNLYCFGVRTVVRETDTAVNIAVIEGTLPTALPVCTTEALQGHVDVTLRQALGHRTIGHVDNPPLNR